MKNKEDYTILGIKKESIIKIIDFIDKNLTSLIVLVATLWIGGLVFELFNGIKEQNYTIFVNYGELALTLFGFTLIGAIFEEKRANNQKIITNLFALSIIFLLSAISFFFIHSSIYIIYNKFVFTIITILLYIAVPVAFLGLVYGILMLVWILLTYLRDFLKENK